MTLAFTTANHFWNSHFLKIWTLTVTLTFTTSNYFWNSHFLKIWTNLNPHCDLDLHNIKLFLEQTVIFLRSEPSLWPWPSQQQTISGTNSHFLKIFVHTTTNWNHLSDDQVKDPTFKFKCLITTPSITEIPCTSCHIMLKVRSCHTWTKLHMKNKIATLLTLSSKRWWC